MSVPIQSEKFPEYQPNFPYTELKPLPPPKERCPLLIKTTKVAFLLFTMTTLFAAGGAILHLATLSVTIETGVGAGTAIGLLIGAVFSWVQPVRTLSDRYLIDTLEQITPMLQTRDKVANALCGLKKTFEKPLRFHQTYENHTLQNRISHITDAMRGGRLDVQRVWRTFLIHLNGQKVVNADGREITLDLTLQLGRLEDQLIEQTEQLKQQLYQSKKSLPARMEVERTVAPFPKQFALECLESTCSTYEEDLTQIREMQEVCFGEGAIFNEEMLKETLSQHKDHRCFVVRDLESSSNKIYAFAWTMRTEEGIALAGLARDPGATGARLGSHLIRRIKSDLPRGELLHLKVRKTNPAVALYENEGFQLIDPKSPLIPNYYSNPKEDAYWLGFKNL